MYILNSWTPWGGLFDLSPGSLFLLAFLYTALATHTTIEAVTIYLHRTVTHGALKLHPIVSMFFRIWLWLTTGMKTKEWVAIHRKHHQNVDTENDPHSPIFFGLGSPLHVFIWCFFLGVRNYVRESHNQETMEKHGHGTPDDWLESVFSKLGYYFGVAIILPVLNVCLFGLPGALVWGVQAYWIPIFAAGVINGLGHWYGYRNYDRNDPKYPKLGNSSNICRWGWFIGGEELHNNHHADPASPFFAHKVGEFDLGGEVVKVLCYLRLAELRRPLIPLSEIPEKNST